MLKINDVMFSEELNVLILIYCCMLGQVVFRWVPNLKIERPIEVWTIAEVEKYFVKIGEL